MRVINSTSAVVIRMREKAALRLSGAPDAATFAELAEESALNFAILCAIRVTMRECNRNGQDHMDTCIIEAVEQDIIFVWVGRDGKGFVFPMKTDSSSQMKNLSLRISKTECLE